MEEEPIEEPNSRTPLFILAAATAALVIVGIISFSKFVAAQKDAHNDPISLQSTKTNSNSSTETKRDENKIRGRVIDFSEEWNFITMDIGSEQNVSEGDEFYVTREEITKGIVKVDQVFPTQAIAVFVTENDFSAYLAPKIGDEIRDLE